MSKGPVKVKQGGRDKKECRVHLLPCKIQAVSRDSEQTAQAPAKVDHFFDPVIRRGNEGGSEVYTAAFRGRPLQGVEVAVPQGYTGVVLKECSLSNSESREFVVAGSFGQFHYWNLQTPPTPDDKLLQALSSWTQLSHSLHAPIPPEENVET